MGSQWLTWNILQSHWRPHNTFQRCKKIIISFCMVWSIKDFKKTLMTWYEKADSDILWSTFKHHFTQVYANLLKICGNSLKSSMFHQANSTVVYLTNDFETIKQEILGSVNAHFFKKNRIYHKRILQDIVGHMTSVHITATNVATKKQTIKTGQLLSIKWKAVHCNALLQLLKIMNARVGLVNWTKLFA